MKRGLFYTLSIIILLIPVVMLILFYINLGAESVDDEVVSMRCNQLGYFVEDVRKDLTRANVIFGRRAAVYAVDYVVGGGTTLENYAFNCTSECAVNCTTYTPPPDGGEAAISELVLCGTLAGQNASFMTNHTLPKWVGKIQTAASEMNYNTTFTVLGFSVVAYDAFNFSLLLDYTLDAEDVSGLCRYRGPKTREESITTIVGLEDPIKPLNTKGRVFSVINDCPMEVSAENVLGESGRDYGEGSDAGRVVYASELSNPDAYCSTNNVSDKVLVMDTSFGSCNQIEQSCFNASTDDGDHFAGVVNFGPDDPQSFSIKCGITIPWISDTDELNLTDGECVAVKNMDSCIVHQVLGALKAEDINTSCYQQSSAASFDEVCGAATLDGPSFFDRLEGRLSLSEAYSNQSRDEYNNTRIGLVSLINLHDLRAKNLQVNEGGTWIDYLYFNNITGCESLESCSGDYSFKVDCAHAHILSLDTSCVNGSNVKPTSNINTPTEASTVYCSDAPINVSGWASDCDGSISRVDVSLDNETSAADGTVNWSMLWSPAQAGDYSLCSQAVDERYGTQTPASCVNTTVACCGGSQALSVSFQEGYPNKNPGNNKPVNVMVGVVDENCLQVSGAEVNVTADGDSHSPEYGVMLENIGGVYGNGAGSHWQSQTLFGNDESINVTVTAEKTGYSGDSVNVHLFVHFI